MMARRTFFGVAAALCGALGLSGCGRSATSRFKLTLAIDTPSGVKSGSGVIETRVWEVRFPERGIPHQLLGEAIYVDLGPGRRPLIALLTSNKPSAPLSEPKFWSQDGGPMTDYFLELYGEKLGIDDLVDKEARLARYRGPRDIPPAALPDLVTFADVSDPNSVMAVDPDNLEATLGPGVKWRRTTLEVTDEAVTTGIENVLPWLRGFAGSLAHPGTTIRTTNELGDTLSGWNFKQGIR
jgi:hypothetical protein